MNAKQSSKSEENQAVEGQKKRIAFLDMLLEASDNGYNLSQEDIREGRNLISLQNIKVNFWNSNKTNSS